MTCKAKVGGSWRDISKTLVKVGGSWREVEKTLVKIGGVWRDSCNSTVSEDAYGVRITRRASNPETAVQYIDNSTGFAPARGNNGSFDYGSWRNVFPFNQIRPCVLRNGVVDYYLNPDDYTKKADGSSADITSSTQGNVMIEFPKIYWKIESDNDYIYVRYSDRKVDSNYKCLAHTKGSTEKSKVYISAYLGRDMRGVLRSISGVYPTESLSIGDFRTLAQENGSGYEMLGYYQLLMLQVLYVVMFKNLNSQVALGRGFVDGSANASIFTGGTNTRGMFYGSSSGTQRVKFCGIEDFYGVTNYWIDGLYSDSNRNALIGTQNFNNTGSGYTNYGQLSASYLNGYIYDVQGDTHTGFIMKSKNGNASTYYCDSASVYPDKVPSFGGSTTSGDTTGVFALNLYYSSSQRTAGARIMYL